MHGRCHFLVHSTHATGTANGRRLSNSNAQLGSGTSQPHISDPAKELNILP